MKREKIVQDIKQSTTNIPGIQVIMYGSEARGDAREDSDIDLLILVDKDKVSYDDEVTITSPIYDIELKYGVIISCNVMPKKSWTERPFNTPYYLNVEREGVVL